jgi:hypothetical protein
MAKPIETLSPTDEAIFRAATLKSLQGAAEDPDRIGAEYLPLGVGAVDPPLQVADAAARKLAATYTTAEVTVANGIKVIQDDLPDVVWVLLDDSDITVDANWFGAPRTNSSGQLPLSGVMLNTGNFPFSFSEYIPAASDRWLESTATANDVVKLFSGITIPGSLIQVGNKLAFTGHVRMRKDSSGINSGVFLTLATQAVFDDIEANPAYANLSTVVFPQVAISDALATLELQGHFHAVFTFTAVTSTTTNELRLVADAQFTDGGKIYNFTTGPAYAALANPISSSGDQAGFNGNFIQGEDAEICVGLLGQLNAQTKIFQISVVGGINVFVP